MIIYLLLGYYSFMIVGFSARGYWEMVCLGKFVDGLWCLCKVGLLN